MSGWWPIWRWCRCWWRWVWFGYGMENAGYRKGYYRQTIYWDNGKSGYTLFPCWNFLGERYFFLVSLLFCLVFSFRFSRLGLFDFELCYLLRRGHWVFPQWLQESIVHLRATGWTRQSTHSRIVSLLNYIWFFIFPCILLLDYINLTRTFQKLPHMHLSRDWMSTSGSNTILSKGYVNLQSEDGEAH